MTTKTNPYEVHASELWQQVLEAASTCEDCLLEAGGALDDLLCEELDKSGRDGVTFATHFDYLKSMYESGKFDTGLVGPALEGMPPPDLFFALALSDNDLAYQCFDIDELRDDWTYIDMAGEGLFYALSASYAFMYGLRLKAQTSYLH